MKRNTVRLSSRLLLNTAKAVLTVVITTVPLFLIGRAALGEAVIALLYLIPVAWSGSRWGLIPGTSAALVAALCFDFFFIPPFFTFAVARLEGWLVLAIFLGVAVLVVERIQASLSRAREAVFMYELSAALSRQRTPEAVAHTVAVQIRQLFQATLVNVMLHPEGNLPGIALSEPAQVSPPGRPDRVVPLVNAWGLVGEIQIWRGPILELPAEDGRLLQNFAAQTAQALERTRQLEREGSREKLMPRASTR